MNVKEIVTPYFTALEKRKRKELSSKLTTKARYRSVSSLCYPLLKGERICVS